ncbi:hypothetical protein JNUCC64_05845 [Streptomyces sp. JNUCC 64]
MSSPSSPVPGGAPETVLVDGGTTARFDGRRLLVVRGRTSWHLPVRALRTAERTTDGTVRVEIAGLPGEAARHGLGTVFELRGPNHRATEAFLGQLRAAVIAHPTVPDGHALVERREADPRGGPSPRTRRRLVIGSLVVAYYTALVVTGVLTLGAMYAGVALFLALLPGSAALAGAVGLWRTGRRLRSLLLLRRRGIGVVGRAFGRARLTRGPVVWEFSLLTFTTLDGRRMTGVPSVVSARVPVPAPDTVVLSYDPERPTRASRPPTPGFLVRTLLIGVVSLSPVGFLVLLYTAMLLG